EDVVAGAAPGVGVNPHPALEGDVGQVPERAPPVVEVLEPVAHLLDDKLRARRQAVAGRAAGSREGGAIGVGRLVAGGGARRVRAMAAGSKGGGAGVVVAGGRSRPVVIEDVLPAVRRGGGRGAGGGEARR